MEREVDTPIEDRFDESDIEDVLGPQRLTDEEFAEGSLSRLPDSGRSLLAEVAAKKVRINKTSELPADSMEGDSALLHVLQAVNDRTETEVGGLRFLNGVYSMVLEDES